MAKSIKSDDLDSAIEKELTTYHRNVVDKINVASEAAVKALVQKTKKTAPKRSGNFRRSLSYKIEENKATGNKRFIWGAKYPHSRLTHLLVNGHAKKGGGRVPGDPFLKNALDEVLPAYENDVEEAVKNGK